MSLIHSYLLYPYQALVAWIDRTAMYLVVVYMLSILVTASLLCGLLGLVSPTVPAQLVSLVVAVTTGYVVSVAAARLRGITANHHSSIITALIIFFLISPDVALEPNLILAGTVAVAIISKYVLVIRSQHIVNPAALAVWLLALTGYGYATWWVATPWLVLPLIITGVIVIAKIRKWILFLSFITTAFGVFVLESWQGGSALFAGSTDFFAYYPALFLGFFMLTEPFTMPPTKRLQFGYGVCVAVLSNSALVSSFVRMTPELALLVGNVVFYPSTLRRKLFLKLETKREIAANTWEFIFTKPTNMVYKAGQYLEWMLPHADPDTRGIRRYFTIASAPTETTLRLGLKIMTPGSSFKAALLSLPVGGTVVASQRAGDFTLPAKSDQKIAMVAGGIGVTPFRSQVQSLIDTKSKINVTLFYCANTSADIAYRAVWTQAASALPFTLVPVIAKEPANDEQETGYLNGDIITRRCPDFLTRTWYVSGPLSMVNATVTILRSLGVPNTQIKKDFFPGLA